MFSFLRHRLWMHGSRESTVAEHSGQCSPVAVLSEQELMVACPTSGERDSRHPDIVAGRSRGQLRVPKQCISSRGVSRCDHTAELPSPEAWTSARPPLPQVHSESPGWRRREGGRRRWCTVTKDRLPFAEDVLESSVCWEASVGRRESPSSLQVCGTLTKGADARQEPVYENEAGPRFKCIMFPSS